MKKVTISISYDEETVSQGLLWKTIFNIWKVPI